MIRRLRTAVLSLAGLCLASLPAAAGIVINELVYDSPGTDTQTWLELKGDAGMSLTGYSVVGVNGNGCVIYATVDLVGQVMPADGYFVIAQGPTVLPPGVADMTNGPDWQNGPDTIQLLQGTTIVDAVAYEPHTTECMVGETAPAPALANSLSSLARCPDGSDTNNNSVDFVVDATPTPGAANDATCAPPVPTVRTLCEVAVDDANGVPALLNQLVQVEGLCVAPSGTFGTTQEFVITDGTCCVAVFGGAINPAVLLGDYVRVVGTVAHFNGRTEISTPYLAVSILTSGNPLPAPTVVSTFDLSVNGENYESCLIEVRCVNIVSGTWPAVGQNQSLQVDDGSGPVALFIDKDTNIPGSPQPTGTFSVIGIGSQFDSTSPYADGYEIVPRWLDDLLLYDCAPTTGACCFADGSCGVQTGDACGQNGGSYLGDGTICDPNPCPQPGACCYANGSCVIELESSCAANGGSFQGGACDPNPCPQPPGACCFADGSCLMLFQADCLAQGGNFFGVQFVCDPNPCPQPYGACCFQGENCAELTAEECALVSGTWHGANTTCDPNPCIIPTGACCAPDGGCTQSQQAACLAPSVYMGDVVACDPNPCPQPTGACCYQDGTCAVTTQVECFGLYSGNFTTCDPNNCPQPPATGACCFQDGTCTVLTAAECGGNGGEYYGDDTVCDPNPCPPPVPTERGTWGGVKHQYR